MAAPAKHPTCTTLSVPTGRRLRPGPLYKRFILTMLSLAVLGVAYVVLARSTLELATGLLALSIGAGGVSAGLMANLETDHRRALSHAQNLQGGYPTRLLPKAEIVETLHANNPAESEMELLTGLTRDGITCTPHAQLPASQVSKDGVVLYLHTDWCSVKGQSVEVRQLGEYVRSGTVEAVTEDNSILWIAFDGAHRRIMYERAEGHTLWTPSPPANTATTGQR